MSDALGIFHEIDVNHNGSVSIEEFGDWWEVSPFQRFCIVIHSCYGAIRL